MFDTKQGNSEYPKMGIVYSAGWIKLKDIVFEDAEREKVKSFKKTYYRPKPKSTERDWSKDPQLPKKGQSNAELLWVWLTTTDLPGWNSMPAAYQQVAVSADKKGLFKNDLRMVQIALGSEPDDHAVDLVCKKWEAEGGIVVDDNPNDSKQDIFCQHFDHVADIFDYPDLREELGLKNDADVKKAVLPTKMSLEDFVKRHQQNTPLMKQAREHPEVKKILEDEKNKQAKVKPKPQSTPGTAEELLKNPRKE